MVIPRMSIGMHDNFEEHPLGTSMNIEFDIRHKTNTFKVKVDHLRYRFRNFQTYYPVTHKHGKSDLVMPTIDRKTLEKTVSLTPNRYQLLSFTPVIQEDGKNSTTHCIASFIRATQILTK